jgi:FAD/FMN-containing dehydrogenase
MTSHTLNHVALKELRHGFTGDIITPDHSTYDEARKLFNAMIDRHPSIIAQCAGVDDVVRSIHVARHHGLEIAVRGGGHGVAGKALTDGGLVIDLRQMHAVSVNPTARTVTVGGGATMGHLDRGTEPYGLATTGGRASTTGVGGYILGGGSGWLDRKFGLACDNLLSVELVTARGDVICASENEHPDLFWALHGGGGNFGVATSFTLRLYELSSVAVMLLMWPPDAGADVLRTYRDFIESAPDDIGGGALFLTGPAEDFVPKSLVGRLAFVVLITYVGPLSTARQAAAPMLELGHPGEFISEMPYADLQCMLDDPPGYRNYCSVEYLDTFPDEAIDRFCAHAQTMIVPSGSQHILLPQGGALGRGRSDYPLPWRQAPWLIHPYGLYQDAADDQRARQWTHDIRADLKPWESGAVYLNFIGDEGQDRVVAGLGRENYVRLAQVKAQYDPENVFHLNHNIKPS